MSEKDSKQDSSNEEYKGGKVEITDGYVILKPFLDRKTARAYYSALFNNVDARPKGGDDAEIDLPMENVYASNDALVEGLVDQAFINEKEVPVDSDFIGSLAEADFDKISKICLLAIRNKKN